MLFHGDVPSVTQDKVVSDGDVEKLRRLADPSREVDVFLRWLRITGRMVVKEDDAERVKIECQTDDVSCTDGRVMQRSDENFTLLDDAISRIEKDDAEVFLHVERVACDEARASEINAESVACFGGTLQHAAREFHCRGKSYGI
jgi:hypothetical protein